MEIKAAASAAEIVGDDSMPGVSTLISPAVHVARDRDKTSLTLPLHLRRRARKRLHRLHPGQRGLRSGRISGLDGISQLRRKGNG
ncbi:hypothetical protein J7M22_12435 [Candidatus Poribacteria bacterium]|nr:hypothetical protein [Candidatus Poribacteria bacterium]